MPLALVPIRLPTTRLPDAATPLINTPESLLIRDQVARAGGRAANCIARGIDLDADAVGDRRGPVASVPMKLPSTTFPVAEESICTPRAAFPEMMFRAATVVPPIVLPEPLGVDFHAVVGDGDGRSARRVGADQIAGYNVGRRPAPLSRLRRWNCRR